MLPGIESWYELGNKSRTSRIAGEEKLNRISEHVNMIFRIFLIYKPILFWVSTATREKNRLNSQNALSTRFLQSFRAIHC